MREFSWLDILFGFFLAAVLLITATVVMSVVVVFFPDRTILVGNLDFIYIFPPVLLAGMAFLAWKYPGPGHIVETPISTLGILLVLPSVAVAVGLAGSLSNVAAAILFEGMFVTTLVGFAVFFAIVAEAMKYPLPKTSWPIDRPASLGWGGIVGVPIRRANMYAGLERGGTEEERPDTYARMKRK